MKKLHTSILSTILSLLLCQITYAQCQDVFIATQEALDTFANCTIVEGNLTITSLQGGDFNSNNLSVLNSITSIEGNLYLSHLDVSTLSFLSNLSNLGGNLSISNCNYLFSLNSLENLTEIGGNLSFNQITSLDDFTGLHNVIAIGGSLSLSNIDEQFPPMDYPDETINNFEGLESLTTIGGDLYLLDTRIKTFEGLENLTAIGDDIKVNIGNDLDSFQGLNNLMTIGGNLICNSCVDSIQGLNSLTTVEGELNLSSLELPNIQALQSLQNIGGNFSLQNIYELTNLEGLNNLTNVGGIFSIINIDPLTNIQALANLTTIDSSLLLINLESLTTLQGLESITTIGGNLTLQNLETLNSLEGLNNLTTIEQDLYIQNNQVADTQPLQNLNYIGGNISLINLEQFDNIQPLQNITEIYGSLNLTSLPSVTDIQPLQNITSIEGHLMISFLPITNLNPLENITFIGGEIDFHYLELTTLYPLSNFTTLESGLSLEGLNNITNFEELSNLTTIKGGLTLRNFDNLPDLTPLQNITTIEHTLAISNSGGLTTLQAFENLTTLGGLSLSTLDDLTNLNGLENTNELTYSLALQNLPLLNNIDPLQDITSIGESMTLSNLPVLSNIQAFQNLTNIGSSLRLQELVEIPTFENLNFVSSLYLKELTVYEINSFPELIAIDGTFEITGNPNLVHIGGFDELADIKYNTYISNNPLLSSCCIIKCFDNVTTSNISLSNNDGICNDYLQVLENCSGSYDECQTSYHIKAFAYHDINENGTFDAPQEYGLFNQSFSMLPDVVTTYTNDDGISTFFIDTGDYVLQPNISEFWELTQANEADTVTIDDHSVIFYYGFHPTTQFTDVSSDLTSGFNRCSMPVNYYLSYKNEGTNAANGHISLKPDDLIDFIESDPPPSYTENGTMYWDFENLYPSYQEKIKIIFQMPNAEFIGELLESEVELVTIDSVGAILSQDNYIHSKTLLCAYDPNDKAVTPPGIGEDNLTLFEDSLLKYTVRFQNTGNDTAFNVAIRDTLSNNLDWSSFKVITQSHELKTLYQENEGIIEFQFNDIYLPDSNINELASHGFVKYEILIKDNLPENTAIENTAHIYFDFNPAIVTNTTQNTMVTEFPMDVSVIEVTKNQKIHLYPNPTKNILNINTEGESNTPIDLQLFDIVGNSILHQKSIASQQQLHLQEYPKGIYYLQIKIGNKVFNEKIIIQ